MRDRTAGANNSHEAKSLRDRSFCDLERFLVASFILSVATVATMVGLVTYFLLAKYEHSAFQARFEVVSKNVLFRAQTSVQTSTSSSLSVASYYGNVFPDAEQWPNATSTRFSLALSELLRDFDITKKSSTASNEPHMPAACSIEDEILKADYGPVVDQMVKCSAERALNGEVYASTHHCGVLTTNATFDDAISPRPLGLAILQPIYPKHNSTVLVGTTVNTRRWEDLLSDNHLDPSSNGKDESVFVVVTSAYHSTRTYRIRNGEKPVFASEGDSHDTDFNDYAEERDVCSSATDTSLSSSSSSSSSSSLLKTYQCMVVVYPTQEFQDSYTSLMPLYACIASVSIFLLSALVFRFLLYREKEKLHARIIRGGDSLQESTLYNRSPCGGQSSDGDGCGVGGCYIDRRNSSARRRDVSNHVLVRYVFHELRNPLNTISMGLQILDAELKQAQQAHEGAGAAGVGGVGVVGPNLIAEWSAVLQDVRDGMESSSSVLHELLLFDSLHMQSSKHSSSRSDLQQCVESPMLMRECRPIPILQLLRRETDSLAACARPLNVHVEVDIAMDLDQNLLSAHGRQRPGSVPDDDRDDRAPAGEPLEDEVDLTSAKGEKFILGSPENIATVLKVVFGSALRCSAPGSRVSIQICSVDTTSAQSRTGREGSSSTPQLLRDVWALCCSGGRFRGARGEENPRVVKIPAVDATPSMPAFPSARMLRGQEGVVEAEREEGEDEPEEVDREVSYIECGEIVISVQDSGPGFSIETLEKMAREGIRCDIEKLNVGGSISLSQDAAAAIVSAHCGEMTVASDGPGRGSTFTIRLPVYERLDLLLEKKTQQEREREENTSCAVIADDAPDCDVEINEAGTRWGSVAESEIDTSNSAMRLIHSQDLGNLDNLIRDLMEEDDVESPPLPASELLIPSFPQPFSSSLSNSLASSSTPLWSKSSENATLSARRRQQEQQQQEDGLYCSMPSTTRTTTYDSVMMVQRDDSFSRCVLSSSRSDSDRTFPGDELQRPLPPLSLPPRSSSAAAAKHCIPLLPLSFSLSHPEANSRAAHSSDLPSSSSMAAPTTTMAAAAAEISMSTTSASPPAVRACAASYPSSAQKQGQQGRYRALVVDDVALNRKLLVRLLTKRGFDCIEACNGQIALNIFFTGDEAVSKEELEERMRKQKEQQSIDGTVGLTSRDGQSGGKGEKWNEEERRRGALNGGFDLICMDVEMPVLNGPTATKQLREHGCKCLIVGVTGNALPADVASFKALGADHVLAKPVVLEDLIDLWEKRQDFVLKRCASNAELKRTSTGAACAVDALRGVQVRVEEGKVGEKASSARQCDKEHKDNNMWIKEEKSVWAGCGKIESNVREKNGVKIREEGEEKEELMHNFIK